MEKVKAVAIVTAGGKGSRLPGDIKKQFRMIAGKPLIIHTIGHFLSHPDISELIVTLPAEDREYFAELVSRYFPAASGTNIQICEGGAERQDSVYQALQLCREDTDIVLIHDAVRPFIAADLITELIAKAQEHGAVIPVSDVTNTIKVVAGNQIDHTLKRNELVQVYTPQVFAYRLLKKCYDQAMSERYYSTDDAALLEHYQKAVFVHRTTAVNIKITDEFDFFVAQQLLSDDNYHRFLRPLAKK